MIGHIPIAATEIGQQADDLKQIHGIGPALERRFHEAGIHKYSQIAAMTSDELAAYFTDLAGLSPRRIAEYDWVGQARKLAESSQEVMDDPESALPENRLHYAVFTIELLLDGANRAQRTQILHVQSQKESVWEGWDETRLAAFMVKNCGMAGKISRDTKMPALPLTPESASIGHTAKKSPPAGRVNLQALEVFPISEDYQHPVIQSGIPFRVSVILDLSEMHAPRNFSYTYDVILYARRVGSSKHSQIGSSQGKVMAAEGQVKLELQGQSLSAGAYRLEALVMLTPPGESTQPSTDLLAMTESGTIQVY
jgi:hypothetical protein